MDVLPEVPLLTEGLRAREVVRYAHKTQLKDSPPHLPTLALALELLHAQMLGADVASHAVPPVDDLQTPSALLPLLLRDETQITVSGPLEVQTELHQAPVESNAVDRSARHKLLQLVPPPERLPARELRIGDLKKEKMTLHVLPCGASTQMKVDNGRARARTARTGRRRGVGDKGVVWSLNRSLVKNIRYKMLDLRADGCCAPSPMSSYRAGEGDDQSSVAYTLYRYFTGSWLAVSEDCGLTKGLRTGGYVADMQLPQGHVRHAYRTEFHVVDTVDRNLERT